MCAYWISTLLEHTCRLSPWCFYHVMCLLLQVQMMAPSARADRQRCMGCILLAAFCCGWSGLRNGCLFLRFICVVPVCLYSTCIWTPALAPGDVGRDFQRKNTWVASALLWRLARGAWQCALGPWRTWPLDLSFVCAWFMRALPWLRIPALIRTNQHKAGLHLLVPFGSGKLLV